MKKITFLLVLAIFGLVLHSCEESIESTDLNYISFAKSTYPTIGIDIGGSTTADVTVYTGNVSGSDRTFDIFVDPTSTAAAGSYNVPSTVTVPGGTNEGTITIELSDVNLGIGVNKLVLKFTPTDGLFMGGSTAISYFQNCSEVTATLDFIFDFYSDETEWYITDALDGVVAEGGPFAQGIGTASLDIQLCAGRDYTLFVTDAFGDGMNDGTNIGSYTLTIGGTVKVSESGDFTESQSSAFDTK